MSQKQFIETAKIIRQVRKETLRSVEATILYTYFNVGRIINEQYQGNKNHLSEIILNDISHHLIKENGKSYSVDNLIAFRKFYFFYSTRFSDVEINRISKTWNGSLIVVQEYELLIKLFKKNFSLTWLYYYFLTSIEDDKVRDYFEKEAILNDWGIEKLKLKFSEY